MDSKKYPERRVRHLISLPFIWAPLIPILIADVVVEIYHQICLPLYGLPCLKRSEYIRLDRYKLPYLTLTEKIGCLYCEYANGWINYARAIAGLTEQYWCGIKHAKYAKFHEPPHHA